MESLVLSIKFAKFTSPVIGSIFQKQNKLEDTTMNKYLNEAIQHIKSLPTSETMHCLWHKKKLRDGVMPAWLTSLINWATDNQ